MDILQPDIPATAGTARHSPYAGSPILNIITEKQLRTCVHCGLCLSYCPTYRANQLEADSPRGRIFQIRQFAAGAIPATDPDLHLHLDRCLGCRACETACPSSVPYGALLEAARAELPPATETERAVRRATLGFLFLHPWAMRAAGWGLRFYQKSGLQRLARASGLLRRLPGGLGAQEAMLPAAQGGIRKRRLPATTPARPGPARYRVALLTGCVQDELFRGVNAATVRVLARNGCEVVLPAAQRCCGALHAHTGERPWAQQLARANIAAFEATGADYYLVNASGCGAQMKAYDHLLHDDPAYAARAQAFVARTRDFAEFLDAIGFTPPAGRLPVRVTYQDACHLKHGQRVATQPRRLLRAIPGLDFVEMAESDWCCGSAGIYNVTQPAMSGQVLDWKTANIAATSADVVVASNPGCAIQIGYGMRARGRPVRVLHLAEILEWSYRREEKARVQP